MSWFWFLMLVAWSCPITLQVAHVRCLTVEVTIRILVSWACPVAPSCMANMRRLPAKVTVCILVKTCRRLPTVAVTSRHSEEMAVGGLNSIVMPVVRKIWISASTAGGERIIICGSRWGHRKHWWVNKMIWWLQWNGFFEARLLAGSANLSQWVVKEGAMLARPAIFLLLVVLICQKICKGL